MLGHDEKPGAKGLSNIPFGMFQVADYEQLDVELDPGDCVINYTDALIESCDADGEMLGEAGLLRVVNLLGDTPADKLIPALLQEIGERFPENLSADDVTLLVVRANGNTVKYSFSEKLGAVGRFFKTLFHSGSSKPNRPHSLTPTWPISAAPLFPRSAAAGAPPANLPNNPEGNFLSSPGAMAQTFLSFTLKFLRL